MSEYFYDHSLTPLMNRDKALAAIEQATGLPRVIDGRQWLFADGSTCMRDQNAYPRGPDNSYPDDSRDLNRRRHTLTYWRVRQAFAKARLADVKDRARSGVSQELVDEARRWRAELDEVEPHLARAEAEWARVAPNVNPQFVINPAEQSRREELKKLLGESDNG